MVSFADMKRCKHSVDGKTKGGNVERGMKDEREQDEKAGEHEGKGEQSAAMVTVGLVGTWERDGTEVILRKKWLINACGCVCSCCAVSIPQPSMRLLGLVLPLSSIHLALAITFPIRGFLSDSNHLSKRSNLTGISIKNGGNLIYGADINLGGNNFSVVLDTGRHVYPRSLSPFLLIKPSALTSG